MQIFQAIQKKLVQVMAHAGLILKFLLISSNLLIPEYSILIKCNPTKPIINGNKKLTDAGKKPVAFILKKDDKNTSKILINIKDNPKIKNKFKFDLSGFKKFILFIYFSLIAIFLLYQFIKTEIDKLNDR